MRCARRILAILVLLSFGGAPRAGSTFGESARSLCGSLNQPSGPVANCASASNREANVRVIAAASSAPKSKAPTPLFTEGEGSGEGEPEGESGADQKRSTLRHLLPIGTALLMLGWAVSRPGKVRGRITGCLLAGLAALSVGNYTDFGNWPNRQYVNGWEFFHYYLGSKYLPELGYTRLYDAALIADEETGLKFHHEKGAIRDLVSGGGIRVEVVLERRGSVLSHFSTERWTEFKQDIGYFKGTLSSFQWNNIFHDKGYNATPVWSMGVTWLTNAVSTSRPLGLLGLALLDPLLIVIALGAVWRSFDHKTSLLMVVLIGTHMIMSHTHMKGALLRTDWVVSLVLAVCALKTNRPFAGGALTALAATSRVFPVVFAVGIFARILISEFRGEPRRALLRRFAAGFGVTAGTLLTTSMIVIGTEHWQEFATKIWQHNDSFSAWRVGFKHLFLGAYEYLPLSSGTHQEAFHDRWLVWWAIQVTVLLVFVHVTRRLKDWEVLACGFVPTFFLVAPSYYYYLMLVMPLLFFAERSKRPECVAGLVWLFASSSVAYIIYDGVGRELPLFYALSCMLMVVCLLMCFSSLLQTRRKSQELPLATPYH